MTMWRKLALITTVLFTLSACSSTTFLYNRLDILLPWYMGDYVDLNREQKQQLDELLEPLLRWHRMQELPRYLQTLQTIQANLDRPLEVADFEHTIAEFEAAFERLEVEALELLLVVGEGLDEEQVQQFLAVLEDEQSEYEEKYLSRDDEEYVEEAYENLLENTEDYLGRLDWGQKETLQQAAQNMRRADSVWLQERQEWVDELRQYLRREPGWQQAMRAALTQRDQGDDEQYNDVFSHNTLQIQQALVTVVNARTDKQDRRLRRRLSSFAEDLETLIEQGRKRGYTTSG